MRKPLLTFALSALSIGALAQGTINFFNNFNTLISLGDPSGGNGNVAINGAPGSFYFALLTNGGSGPFVFTGVYGTNQAAAGRFNGGGGIGVPGWAAGSTRTFEVAGWENAPLLGPVFNPLWLTTMPYGFGLSSTASGAPGGGDPVTGATLPTLNIFGGPTGIPTGFIIDARMTRVPEPSSMALAGLGAAAFLMTHRCPSKHRMSFES